MVEKHRIRHSMLSSSVLKVNGGDRPLECTTEERTAKSLALIFSVQLICTLVSNIMGSIRATQSLLRCTNNAQSYKVMHSMTVSALQILKQKIITICFFAAPSYFEFIVAAIPCIGLHQHLYLQ